jgi:hypothetical protein
VAQGEYRGTTDLAGLTKVYLEELGTMKRSNDERSGGLPMLVGEFGVPYEMNGGAAYRTGDFGLHEHLLHAMYGALDELAMSATQWNYTPDNTHAHGDQWNHEDLSVFCAEDGGGRAVAGFSRPYPRHSQGRPVRMQFEPESRRFELILDASTLAAGPTEVVVPSIHYPDGVTTEVSAGAAEHDAGGGVVRWTLAAPTATATIVLRPA